ncbi:MAG: STAS domain-containing protein [Ignavibacteriales bacterium]|jgi:anti-sigma B factor antagonist|nr:STAS domain-containing protein [Ignavibacteriaceae bacterium]NLH61391.1 STAS domain-containing protein [Ignavibacteriales bacterium]HOJ17093.1 STAS domain-containing protein [Ignavibacteriaceae bacterium]HPO56535.1 STAS domain-containing protein [Ignavibacteriaceae bacterium]
MAEFSTNTREIGNVSVLEVNGYIDAHTAPQLEGAINDLITRNKYKIVVDFDGLKYISSAGLGVFMAFIETVRSNEGDIKLAAMQPNVFNIFDLLGFPLLYEITHSVDEAVTKFK